MLRLIARHADEWKMPASEGPQLWGDVNARLGKACAEVGRNPAEVRRFGQVPLRVSDL
ncbi:hypothetical protein LAUMK13_02838 [Mycobacterium innocens]|uniref:Uncharacterized protein n=1 Tax=Mycobacterium innocens TaxID=2341083 RepID=A0A498Q3N3_9MYCO|nr:MULTISPECIES: hypothetical protein [Mycobacterium]VBA39931.1 hypothetical protein LAUMK13_02838 [Mycobacterium innocens]